MFAPDWAGVAVDGLSALGTIGAFAVGLFLFRREHRREEARAEDERRSQAVKVSAWVEARRTGTGGREIVFRRVMDGREDLYADDHTLGGRGVSDATGEVCIWTYAASHVLVDVNGWFTSGFEGRAARRFVDTRSGQFRPL